MAIILFDGSAHQTLLPLTFTRPVANLRLGILTIAEKWGKHLDLDFSYHTQAYLSAKFPKRTEAKNLFINGAVCPDENLLEAIYKLNPGEALKHNGQLIAIKLGEGDAKNFDSNAAFDSEAEYAAELVMIKHPEDIFRKNDAELRKDFQLLTKGRTSAAISS